jgi:hypothetical protein
MKRKSLTIFVLLALSKIGLAETVPVEKAKSVASGFFANALQQRNSMRMLTNLELVSTVNTDLSREQLPSYYIFNNTAGTGFVIIAGNDAVDPVIGYSLESNIDANDLPPAFAAFMEAEQHAIERARKII